MSFNSPALPSYESQLGDYVNNLQKFNESRAKYLANQSAQATLPYAASQAAATLGETNARTGYLGQQAGLAGQQAETLRQTNPFAAASMQSEISQKNAAAQLLQQQADTLRQTNPKAADKMQADIDNLRAEASLKGQQSQYFGTTAGAALLNSIAKAMQGAAPLSPLKYADPTTKAIATRAYINGEPGIGAAKFNNGIYGNLQDIASNLLNQFNRNGQQGAGAQLGGGQYNQQDQPRPKVYEGMPKQDLSNILGQRNLSNELNSGMGDNVPSLPPAQVRKLVSYSTPEEMERYNKQQSAAVQNTLGSSGLQQKANYAINLAKTMDQDSKQYGIPAITFAKYMGAGGQARLLADKANNSITSDPNSTYNKYMSFVSNIPIKKEQLTQFFGGSISPSAQKDLDTVINPVHWTSNPQSAMLSYQNLRSLIHAEGDTATKQVGKDDEFNKMFPEHDTASLYKAISENPEQLQSIKSVLSKEQLDELKKYHKSHKK